MQRISEALAAAIKKSDHVRDAPQFPNELAHLACHILPHLDDKQRVCCSLVCHRWKTVVESLPAHVTWSDHVPDKETGRITIADKYSSSCAWLSTRGHLVTSLEFSAQSQHSCMELALPCAALQNLRSCSLQGCDLLPGGSSSNNGSDGSGTDAADNSTGSDNPSNNLASTAATNQQVVNTGPCTIVGLTGLQSLSLRGVILHGVPDGLHALSALTGLRQLQLRGIGVKAASQQPAYMDKSLCLDALTQLVTLVVDPRLYRANTVGAFSCLQRLQELALPVPAHSTKLFSDLPASLTKLCMVWAGQDVLCRETVPSLAGLTALKQLLIVCRSVGSSPGCLPDFLSEMQHLQILDLVEPHNATTLHLVDAMPHLVHLKWLSLKLDERILTPLPAHKVSALFPAGPHLRGISITAGIQLFIPEGAGQYIFTGANTYAWNSPTPYQMPGLKRLVLGCNEDVDSQGLLLVTCDKFMGSSEIARMVSCCPNLEHLWLMGVVQAEADLCPLLQLSGLTHLAMGGESVCDGAVDKVLSHMTTLQQLQVACAPLTDSGLRALTSLTGLKCLEVWGCSLSNGITSSLPRHKIKTWYAAPDFERLLDIYPAPAGMNMYNGWQEAAEEEPLGPGHLTLHSTVNPPDVWRQLQALSAKSTEPWACKRRKFKVWPWG